MGKVLSVIIPSYNTAPFMDRNIPTLLDGEILDALEVLIVNDGSTDKTGETARKYEERCPGTVRVINKENGGHGSAINLGIDMACGRYFKVVDGDDWVDTRNFRRLIEDLKNQDADLVLSPYDKVDARTGKSKRFVPAPGCGENLSFENVCAGYGKLEIHSITIKTCLLRDNGIRVREHCMYEDNEYDLFPIPFIRTVTVLDYPVYQYLIGQSGQSVSAAGAFRNRDMHYTVLKDCIRYYEAWKDAVAGSKRAYMSRVIIRLIRSQYNIYLRNGRREESYGEFLRFNRDFGRQYPSLYREAGKHFRYIRIVQSGSKPLFQIVSALVRCYKRVQQVTDLYFAGIAR